MKSILLSPLLIGSLLSMTQHQTNQNSIQPTQPVANTKTADNGLIQSGQVKVDQAIPMAKAGLQAGSSKTIVRSFLEEVRSGKDPDKASLYMAETVFAHQMNAEKETLVKRSPQEYASHVREFLALYGNYTFQITELIAEGDKVYARWKQTGTHLTTINGYAASNQSLVEIASAVYRVENGKIAEYWIQIDRLGLNNQLKQHASK
jgi:predicted ester cyclase